MNTINALSMSIEQNSSCQSIIGRPFNVFFPFSRSVMPYFMFTTEEIHSKEREQLLYFPLDNLMGKKNNLLLMLRKTL